MSALPSVRGQRSVGELFGDLTNETTTLVRHEVQLAANELAQKAACAARHAALIATGAMLGVICVGCVAWAIALGLGMLISMWVSALVVAVIVGATAYAVVRIGVASLKAMDPAPRQTMQSIKENKQWIEEQIR